MVKQDLVQSLLKDIRNICKNYLVNKRSKSIRIKAYLLLLNRKKISDKQRIMTANPIKVDKNNSKTRVMNYLNADIGNFLDHEPRCLTTQRRSQYLIQKYKRHINFSSSLLHRKDRVSVSI